MRYRRVSGRYVSVVSVAGLPSGDLLHAVRSTVMVAPAVWQPAADVCETASAIVVTVDVAGVEPDELEVQLFADALVIAGVRPPPPCEPDGVFHRAEIRHGPFRLEVPLPATVDAEAVEARYERGLLCLTLPKLTQSRRE